MERTWKDNLYEAFKISVCVFTLIMLMFGCMAACMSGISTGWKDRSRRRFCARFRLTDKGNSCCCRHGKRCTGSFGEFSEMFDDALRNGNVPYEEMINTLLESELAQQLFSAEEMEELCRTKDAGLQLFRQLMEIYGKDGG